MDSVDEVATEDISTEINKNLTQQYSAKEDQVSSTLSVQNSSKTVNVNSDPKSATMQNEPLCTEKHTTLKRNEPKKIIDYLTLMKDYKTAKAQQNFAEMSRNRSLLWFHKQQNLGYRKRYWMKETSDPLENAAINHNSDPPFHIFHNSTHSDNRNEVFYNDTCVNNRNEEFSSGRDLSDDAILTQQSHGCIAFDDAGVTECNGSSAAKRSRNSPDSVMNHIRNNANNCKIRRKKKKRKHKRNKSWQNANSNVNSRAEITNDNKSTSPKHENKVEQQKMVQENHVTNHTFDKSIKSNDIDSRYNIAPCKKEVDEVIVLDSSDSESSIVVLGTPTPEPPPVICLDSDSENLRHQQETAAAQESLMLNVAAPKHPFREKIQGNNEMTEDNLTSGPSSTNKPVASSSTSRAKGHRSMNNCKKWTAEMRWYYNESWGGEHFDVISLQREMSNNPVKWHVSQRDLHMELYQKKDKGKCTNCSQFGHFNWQCPAPPRPICCQMCGEQGHTEPRCPFPICLQCGEKTKIYVRQCRNCKSKSYCTVCNKTGHSHDICPEVWRKYCTTISSQQVARPQRPMYKPKEQQWCCVCAKKGHFPEDCQPYYVKSITCQNKNGIHTPNAEKKKQKKCFTEFYKRKVHFGMPC